MYEDALQTLLARRLLAEVHVAAAIAAARATRCAPAIVTAPRRADRPAVPAASIQTLRSA